MVIKLHFMVFTNVEFTRNKKNPLVVFIFLCNENAKLNDYHFMYCNYFFFYIYSIFKTIFSNQILIPKPKKYRILKHE